VADRQRKARDMLGADRTLGSAAQAAAGIEDAIGRAIALNRVASAMARMDRLSEAKKVLRTVRQTSEEISEPESKVSVLTRMAYTYGKYLGKKDIASASLQQCEEIAGAIARPEGRIESLLEVALTYFGLGQSDRMQAVLDRSLEAARSLGDERQRADALADAGAILGKMKKADEAKKVFQEAQAAAEAIDDPLRQGHALVHLAQRLAEAGFKGAAQKILRQAEAVADKVADASMRGPLVEKIVATRKKLRR